MNESDQSELHLACEPTTPQAVLAALSTHRRLLIRRAVTENPNTPPGLLVRLGCLFPKSFAQNPSVPLLLIEDPEYLSRWPLLLRRLLSLRELPAFLWYEARRHKSREVRVLLADSPHAPPSLLSSLLHDPSAIVQRRALLNQKTPAKEKAQKKGARTIGDAIAEMCESLGYAPHDNAQLQRALQMLSWREAEVLRLCFGLPEDGQAPVGAEEGIHLGGFIENKAQLTPKEEKVLRARFDIGKKSEHTQEEVVGQDFEVTRERIRSMDEQALRKLRNPFNSGRCEFR
jgi:hypothetical protein